MKRTEKSNWPADIHRVFVNEGISQVAYVPDAGHSSLIEFCQRDATIRDVVLSTEEEGVAQACGAWLGGQKSALLLQSSGVGNCINMLGMVRECRFPLLMVITMRGQSGEFNPWQVPMGQATPGVLSQMVVIVQNIDDAQHVKDDIEAAARLAFNAEQAVAVTLSQKLIGAKRWDK